jgi:hypothetical protein
MEINNHPNYLIYPDGRVYSKPRKYDYSYTNKNGVFVKRICNLKGKFLKFGNDGKQGYLSVTLDGKSIKLHKLVAEHYLQDYNEKKLLGFQIDHIDNNILNNNNDNLQMLPELTNKQKRTKTKNNHSGHKNIYTHHRSGNYRYEKRLNINGKRTTIGYYENKCKIKCLCYKFYVLLKLNLMKKNNIL